MNINIYLRDETGAEMKRLAEEEGLKRNTILRQLAEEWVAKRLETNTFKRNLEKNNVSDSNNVGIDKSWGPELIKYFGTAATSAEVEDDFVLFDPENRYSGLKEFDMSKSIFDDIDD